MNIAEELKKVEEEIAILERNIYPARVVSKLRSLKQRKALLLIIKASNEDKTDQTATGLVRLNSSNIIKLAMEGLGDE